MKTMVSWASGNILSSSERQAASPREKRGALLSRTLCTKLLLLTVMMKATLICGAQGKEPHWKGRQTGLWMSAVSGLLAHHAGRQPLAPLHILL